MIQVFLFVLTDGMLFWGTFNMVGARQRSLECSLTCKSTDLAIVEVG